MLLVSLTENHNGIYISGDYEDLYFLREAVSNMTGDVSSYEGYEYVHNIVQHFVFELLHAYRAERDSFVTRCDTPCYKISMLLPEAVFVANALNDYIIFSESEDFYVYTMADRNSSLADRIKERHYIDVAFIRFFQASVWNAVKELVGNEKFEEIKPYRDFVSICNSKELRYRDYCSEWIDILNIRCINCEETKEQFILDTIENLAGKSEEYLKKERAMKEHAKDGNISYYFDLLEEIKYPDEWEW